MADPGPRFLYGTAWKEDETRACVTRALTAGFRGIDTANQRKHYHEAAVGEALAEAFAGGLAREAVFVQTKFTHRGGQDHRLPYDVHAPVEEQVRQSFERSLQHLHVSTLDAYVLHGPSSRHGFEGADVAAWQAMEALEAEARVARLGVSNVTLEQLQRLCALAARPPVIVQNRCYARTGWDHDVRAFCLERGISYQGFSLLTANDRELRDEVISRAARRHGKSPAQIVFRFALDVGMVCLTGSTDAQHLRDDLACLEFELSAPERADIERISWSR